MPAVRAALLADDGAAVRRAFESDGVWRLEVDGETIEIGPDDVEVRAVAHEQLAVVQDGAVAVALDLTIDDDLRSEGLARELVRALNDLRKERDLALTDRIEVTLHATGPVGDAARRHGDWIAGEVLARSWTVGDADGGDALTVDGTPVGVEWSVVPGA